MWEARIVEINVFGVKYLKKIMTGCGGIDDISARVPHIYDGPMEQNFSEFLYLYFYRRTVKTHLSFSLWITALQRSVIGFLKEILWYFFM